MIVPLLLGGAAFYLGGRYKFAKRNGRSTSSSSQNTRLSMTNTPSHAVPGHQFFTQPNVGRR